jgi:hypothetical protein
MSCCCNNSYSGLPCCCPPSGFSTTTTTTCAAGLCCGLECANGEDCVQEYSSNCAFYTGPDVITDCFTITYNMSVTEVLETVMTYICDNP